MPIKINKKIGVFAPTFTVSSYRNAYAQYQKGIYRDLIAMMERAEVDSYVAGCLLARESGVMRNWSVEPWDESAKAEERAAQLTGALKQLNIRSLFKGILDAKAKIYRVVDFDEWGMVNGLQFPESFEILHQKYFRKDPNDDVLKVDMGGNKLADIPPEALVCEYKRKPFMLSVLRDYILKEFGLESWADFIEIFGHPFILGKYPPGSDATLKEELDTAVNAIARNSRGTMPDTSAIEIVESGKNTGDHKDFTTASDKGIAISILGHANAVEDSPGMQVGENETGFKARRDLSLDDLYWIDENMNKFLRFVQVQNFNDGNYCTFTTDKSDPPDQKELRSNIELAVDAGLEVHISNFKQLGLKVRVSENDDDEWIKKQLQTFEY